MNFKNNSWFKNYLSYNFGMRSSQYYLDNDSTENTMIDPTDIDKRDPFYIRKVNSSKLDQYEEIDIEES